MTAHTDPLLAVTPPAKLPHVLDDAVRAALHGPHRAFAETHGRAVRYPADVSPFTALSDPQDPRSWADLAELLGPGVLAAVPRPPVPPEGWEVLQVAEVMQLVDTALRVEPDPDAVELGPEDVPEILELIARTQPGPFLPRTIELGLYLGIRDRGRLVAMAGERLRPPGWTEISAVCTTPEHRGRGLATRLVRAIAAGIRERGDTPFLHVAATNSGAIRLYEAIGFTSRRHHSIYLVRTPGRVGPETET
ncbi:GNAT family N-acetyltransferase [Streptomyces sp. 3214.6]|uniref:GNAT family N-acetyltransferase n=1 Tax=Streptomyces sp. 3214.6 TaxID=1882757 RepID=UPI0009096FC0|nr:GNAT family N-acetyltransferase [Streptomyces sp. 3214.6]SHH29737.1 Predicted acetyltransferase, GNAT family [Streptomyces sp. 3214.6]